MLTFRAFHNAVCTFSLNFHFPLGLGLSNSTTEGSVDTSGCFAAKSLEDSTSFDILNKIPVAPRMLLSKPIMPKICAWGPLHTTKSE